MAASTAAAERPFCPDGTHGRTFRSVLEHASIRSPSRDHIYNIFSTVRLHETISIRSPSRDYINPFAFTGRYPIIFFSDRDSAEADHLDRFSVRVTAHGRHLSLSFYLPPSVGLLLTIWTRFYVRVYDRAWEAFSLPSIGLLEQFLERDHARVTRASLLAGMLPEVRMSALCALHLKRVCFCVFLCFSFLLVFFFFFSSSLRTNITHAQPLYTKRPQVKTVPYCIHMITFMHKPLYIKKTPC